VTGGHPNDGTHLQIWDCNHELWQQWTFEQDGTLRSMGMCMDVAWGSHQNGAVIQLVNCNGNVAQQFRLSPAGDLVNTGANKCVDVVDQQTRNGTALQLWDCNGQANQKWGLIS
jgi:Ricin-type beta-trefoil lectin domain